MLRKNRFVIIGIIFFGSIFFMLSKLDTGYSNSGYIQNSPEDVKNLHSKLKYVEQQLDLNKRAMSEVRDIIEVFLKKGNIHDPKQRAELENLISNVNNQVPDRMESRLGQPHFNKHNISNTCPLLPHNVGSVDVDMINVYEKLPFEDPDGGVWKQGFSIETSDSEWTRKKLKVFVVPHSHNDPGWIKTVEKYFTDQTQHILNNIVDALSQDSKRRFIWAEMSYLSMWWKVASADRKVKMKRLVDNGQLEMVTAGWVMNDEANTHYFAMIDQMIEGNEWLSSNLGVRPHNGWAIDPFGHTPTMAYILKKMNFKHMLIQRVHYAVKKHFAAEKLLEFRWRQPWCEGPHTDMVCHMMPFYSYDVPHTCGPDPKICCQFDFARLPDQRMYSCPWRVPPVPINAGNVASRSLILLDQYRKKSKLFKSNTLLVILGDDFRYSQMRETNNQFENYARIFDYVNSQPQLNAELKFGTLNEYFEAMKAEIGGEESLPSLSGDFFTYADREDHYWSGYYTSRPFHKMQDRVLESHLRGAEILFSFAFSRVKPTQLSNPFTALYQLLVEARQTLGLFQHHDGITGTAKDHVVVDYGTKMMNSLTNTKKIQSLSAQLLLSRDPSNFNPEVITFDYDEIYHVQNQPPSKHVIKVGDSPVTVVIYNSLGHQRTGVVSIFVSTPHVSIVSSQGEVITSQSNLVWKDGVNSKEDIFEVQFLAIVPPTGLTTYQIKGSVDGRLAVFSSVHVYNGDAASRGSFQVKSVSQDVALKLENEVMEAHFSSSSGYLETIKDKLNGKVSKVALSFVAYTSRNAKDKSGAYLFLPSGSASPHVREGHRPLIRHIDGPISSEVHVILPNLLHRVVLYKGNGDGTQPLGVHIFNDVDVRSGYDNKEIAMRITSGVRSGSRFYTDLNGFQMQQRTTYDKLPLQANFYPIPSMAFIQDSDSRLTLLTGQPLGVASLKEGQLEVIMDRRLMQDDNRGVGQGVRDNVVTPESFVIVVEHWDKDGAKRPSPPLSYPSLASHRISWELLHPLRTMNSPKKLDIKLGFDPLVGRSLPCDVRLLNLRTIQARDHVTPTEQSAMILHRVGRDCGFDSDRRFKSCQPIGSYDIPVASLFPVDDVTMTSLSLQEDAGKLDSSASVTVRPMEVEAIKVRLR